MKAKIFSTASRSRIYRIRKKIFEHRPTINLLDPSVCMCGHTYSKSMYQPGKVANPARGNLNRENEYFLSAFAPENSVSRDGFGSLVPRSIYN